MASNSILLSNLLQTKDADEPQNDTPIDRDNEEIQNNTGNEPAEDEDENSIDDVSNKSATKSDGMDEVQDDKSEDKESESKEKKTE